MCKTNFNDNVFPLLQVIDQYEVSKVMSTYLVAFVVCDFKSVKNTTRNNITLSVFAPPTMINQADYALQVASHIFDFYQEFFGVEYPLPKQGVPSNFGNVFHSGHNLNK